MTNINQTNRASKKNEINKKQLVTKQFQITSAFGSMLMIIVLFLVLIYVKFFRHDGLLGGGASYNSEVVKNTKEKYLKKIKMTDSESHKYFFELFYGDDMKLPILEKIKIQLLEMQKSFHLNLDIKFVKVKSSAFPSVKSNTFQLRRFSSKLSESAKESPFYPIMASKGCLIKYKIIVSATKNYESVKDLAKGKIILLTTKDLPSTMLNFLINMGLDEAEIYSTTQRNYAYQQVKLHSVDAVVISLLENPNTSDPRIYSPEHAEEFTKNYKELFTSEAIKPCTGVFVSKEVKKNDIENFIHLFEHFNTFQNEESIYQLMSRIQTDDYYKMFAGYDWKKINALQSKIKEIANTDQVNPPKANDLIPNQNLGD